MNFTSFNNAKELGFGKVSFYDKFPSSSPESGETWGRLSRWGIRPRSERSGNHCLTTRSPPVAPLFWSKIRASSL